MLRRKKSRYRTSEKLFASASRILPGGVDSPVRAFKAVGATPLFIERASGAHIEDADGNTYIDYVMSWGPLIHGHAPKGLVKALGAAAARGTSFGAPTRLETRLARQVAELMPSMERVRFVSSGTEAAMSAARVARAFTKRDKIVKFEGCYHGHADSFLVQAGSGAMTLGVPTSPGVAAAAARDTLVARYNDLDSVERVFEQNHGEIAAVFVEPIAGNMGVVAPREGFLEGLRRITSRERSLLVFDEVISGFRAAPGRRAAGLRRHTGPHLPGQDHRRRPACGRVRRTCGCDGARRPVGTGVSGGNVVGKSPGDDRRALVSGRTVAEAVPAPGQARRGTGVRPRRCRSRRRRAAAGECVRLAR